MARAYPAEIDREIRRLWVEQGLSDEAISQAIGLPASTVTKKRRRLGLTPADRQVTAPTRHTPRYARVTPVRVSEAKRAAMMAGVSFEDDPRAIAECRHAGRLFLSWA